MDDLTQMLLQQLAGGGLSQISQQVGVDEGAAGSVLSTAMPLLVSALANNASDPTQAQSLHQALGNDHDGSILNDLGGFLGDPQSANGAGILGHVLGGQQSMVTQTLADNTGMDSGQAGSLLEIAAPLVMGALGQQQQQQGLDTDGLADFLGGQQQSIDAANPMISSILTTFLDKDKDGSFLDDLFGMILNFFRRK
ncbi:MAG: DUF937 domain-containing protein [Chloroflexi bacterium]|nr:DUF937 domain-containing protein [Chloroflexota bacterium]